MTTPVPPPAKLPEPADKTIVVIDDGSDDWSIYWRSDESARQLDGAEDERWFENHFEDPFAWGQITKSAMRIYGLHVLAEPCSRCVACPLPCEHGTEPVGESA